MRPCLQRPRTLEGLLFVSSGAVTEASHDFDESFEDDGPGPLLPPEDRVWRHPSEISSQPSGAMIAEVSAARERWLARTPTRAGAWSAGVVGAVLAAGVVLVGTHLSVSTARPSLGRSQATTVATTVVPPGVTAFVAPGIGAIGATVRSGLTVVQVSKADGTVSGNGVVLTPNGKIVVPLSLVSGAFAIAVTTADGAVYAGRVIGTDEATQLAVVSIGITGAVAFTPLVPSSDTSLTPGDWLAVEWSALSRNDRDADNEDSSVVSMGSVRSVGAASTGGNYQLLDSIAIQASDLSSAPVGTVLVNSTAKLVGIITGRKGSNVLEIPGLLAVEVGQQIIEHGRVIHGWLGIEGQCTCAIASRDVSRATSSGESARLREMMPPGVEVVEVGSGTSAAAAGLRTGDVIEAVNGQRVDSMQALQQMLYVMAPHVDVALTVERGTSISTVSAVLQPAA